ncbi:MAG: toxic anion resistance protein [Defluviitaleaceae bacterium]|nr:toxic anion resistance protein [Defluviitaleaceae bacterium]
MIDNDLQLGSAPTLTLTPNLNALTTLVTEDEVADTVLSQQNTAAICQEFNQLSGEEQAVVKNFAQQIDITNTNLVMQYGAAAQKHISDFSSSTLNNVRSKDMGDVGGMLANLTVELRGFNFDEEDKKGFLGMFKKAQNHIAVLKAQYDSAEVNVNKIVDALEKHQITLTKDIALLDKMYDLNLGYFKELTMYILAGKQKLQIVQDHDLKQLQDMATQSGRPEDAQAANDLANKINRFEKRLHDLELTRMISIQMAPQIRTIQNNDALMLEKLQTSIVSTIPLWKSQMVLAISMHHSKQAMEAQRNVNDLTNELLKKNAAALKVNTIEIAKESERGIIDIETLKATNKNLIETLDEVRQIQVEGSKRRNEASIELSKIEGELKQKLLELGKK